MQLDSDNEEKPTYSAVSVKSGGDQVPLQPIVKKQKLNSIRAVN
jgi:hypothetical protein